MAIIRKLDYIVLFWFFLCTLRFYNYIGNIPGTTYTLSSIFFLIYFSFRIITEDTNTNYIFKKGILFVALAMTVSSVIGVLYWDIIVYDLYRDILYNADIILLYFFLLKIRLQGKQIIKLLVFFTVVWGGIEWIQQLTYPTILFQGREEIEIRMGLYRFYLTGLHFAIIVMLYYAQRFTQMTTDRWKSFFIWLIAILSIIGFLSRKQIYVSIICAILAFLGIKGNYRLIRIIIFAVIAYIGLDYLMIGMSDLNEQTFSELTNEDFIRYLATKYFLFDFSQSPLYYLFGTGYVNGTSGIGEKYQYLINYYNYYRVDCGIVGYFTSYGLIGIISYGFLVFQVIKQWKHLLLWHKLYLLYFGLMITMAFWGNSRMGFTSLMLYLYLVNVHIENRNKVRVLYEYSIRRKREENCILQ